MNTFVLIPLRGLAVPSPTRRTARLPAVKEAAAAGKGSQGATANSVSRISVIGTGQRFFGARQNRETRVTAIIAGSVVGWWTQTWPAAFFGDQSVRAFGSFIAPHCLSA